MNTIAVPVSYMGSGSSAITDLLSEFDGFVAENGTFEYVFLHCPNGVFDLEDKLLIGNNALRSDEALHSFRATMKDLYDRKWWWVGGYKQRVSERFLDITNEYIDSLVQYRPKFYWYMQEKTNWKMFYQLVLRRLLRLISLGKLELSKPLLYKDVMISFIDENQFYEKSRNYVSKVMDELGLREHSIILDQLLLPHNLFRIDHYFGDELKVVVVSRDPRDVFVINKYIWSKQNQTVIYPTNMKDFVCFYRNLRASEKICNSSKILRISFEDLIYNYEKTLNKLKEHFGLTDNQHVRKLTAFIPERSIDNTQFFLRQEYKEECSYIAQELSGYLYNFPYEHIPNSNNSF